MIQGRKMDSNKFTESASGVCNFSVLQRALCCAPGLLQTQRIDRQHSVCRAFIAGHDLCCLWHALKSLSLVGSEHQNAVEIVTSM